MSLSRRRFLIASAALPAAAALPRASRAGAPLDVVVIGAGLAGLNAASLLREQGARVLLLEGSSRVGGRCWTPTGWPGTPEFGASQVGPHYGRVRDAARRLGVALAPGAHINAPYAVAVGDTLQSTTDWPQSPANRLVGAERAIPPIALSAFYIEKRTPFHNLDDWLKPESARYDISVAQWLRDQQASPEAMRLILAGNGNTPLEQLSLLRQMQEGTRSALDAPATAAGNGKDVYERFALSSAHVVGGTARLPEAMAAALGERVRLGFRVQAIELDERGATVRVDGRKSLHARFVVVAVPFTALRRVAITPALRGAQGDAVRRMPYSNQSQVWLHVTRPYWEEDGLDASIWSDGLFTLIRQQLEPDGTRVLVSALAFGANSERLDALPAHERGSLALETIAKLRPSTRGRLEVIGTHSWADVPLIGGCSHQYLPGVAEGWVQQMRRPHGRLHFAGEHARTLEVGMESAMESGERAALEVAEKLAG